MKNKYSVCGACIEEGKAKKVQGTFLRGRDYSFIGNLSFLEEKGNGLVFGFFDPLSKSFSLYMKNQNKPEFKLFTLNKKSFSKNNFVGEYYGPYLKVDMNDVLELDYIHLDSNLSSVSGLLKKLENDLVFRANLFNADRKEAVSSKWIENGGVAHLFVEK
jgi:hypothetical protein